MHHPFPFSPCFFFSPSRPSEVSFRTLSICWPSMALCPPAWASVCLRASPSLRAASLCVGESRGEKAKMMELGGENTGRVLVNSSLSQLSGRCYSHCLLCCHRGDFKSPGRLKEPIRQRRVLCRLCRAGWTLTNNCVRTEGCLGRLRGGLSWSRAVWLMPSCVLYWQMGRVVSTSPLRGLWEGVTYRKCLNISYAWGRALFWYQVSSRKRYVNFISHGGSKSLRK